jgi:ketosteroid isomerase-like protein
MESAKEIVVKFYESAGILSKNYCLEAMHPDVVLEWISSKGHLYLDLNDILALSKDLRLSYFDLRAEVQDVIEGVDGKIVILYSYFVRALENPDEEMILASFFTIWEVKDGKLFKGIQMSQLGDK